MSEGKKVFEAEIVGRGASKTAEDQAVAGAGSPFGAVAGMGANPMKAFEGLGKAKSKLLKFSIVFLAVAVFAGYVGATADSTFIRVVSIIGSGITGLLGMFMGMVYLKLRKFKLPGM
ncbi:MAG: hypothetical protein V3V10_02520 [Planctomycetota bacterium]